MAGALFMDAIATAARRCCRSTASTTRSSSACRSRRRARRSRGPARVAGAADRVRGSVPHDAARTDGRRDAGRGLRASQLVDGPQDLGRLGDDDEQGSRGDRGLLAVRRHARPHRRRDPPAERDPFDGRLRRRLGAGADWAIPTCARRSRMRWRTRNGSRPASARSTWRTIGRLDFERPTSRVSRASNSHTMRCAPGRRAGDPERRQRDRRGRVSRRPHPLHRHRGGRRPCCKARRAHVPRSLDEVLAVDHEARARAVEVLQHVTGVSTSRPPRQATAPDLNAHGAALHASSRATR